MRELESFDRPRRALVSAWSNSVDQGGRPAFVRIRRAILAVDIENSTTRADSVKVHLRHQVYSMLQEALRAADVEDYHRDPFVDRGDGVLALVRSVDQASMSSLLNTVVPRLTQLLIRYNERLSTAQRQRLLRLRAVLHTGEINYDDHGCFGKVLDLAFRLLDAPPLKRALRHAEAPLALVISHPVLSAVVRHHCEDLDDTIVEPLVWVHLAGRLHQGWIQVPRCVSRSGGR